MTTQEITIEVEIPDNVKYDGFREPICGESFLCFDDYGIAVMEENGFLRRDNPYGSRRVIVKPKRWRAKVGGEYFFVNSEGKVDSLHDNKTGIDNNLYYVGNYFKTREEVEVKAEQVKKIFEIGE